MRLPLWATTMTLIGVAILCTLGAWQLQRLAWKENLIKQLDFAYENGGEAFDLPALEAQDTRPMTYGKISGRFMPSRALLLGPRTHDDEIGNNLIVPVKIKDRTILVNLGWTGEQLEALPTHAYKGQNIAFEGLLIKPSWNSFTPENIPENNAWYKPDIEQIAQAKDLHAPYPFILRAERASVKFDAAFPNNDRLSPNNNHLQYALFWFSMAMALMVIYLLRFVVKRKN